MKHFISLGAGVQSSTMALMAAHGELSPMPDAAIFADTQAEPKAVYEWLDWLEKQLPFPVYRVTHGSLKNDMLQKRPNRKYRRLDIPAFIVDGGKVVGLINRACTRDYKIRPIDKKVRELIGLRPGQRAPTEVVVTQWIGISRDEVQRMKPSRMKYVQNRWPLVDRGMRRHDCLLWMERNGYGRPPRSACTFCPYHSNAEWLSLTDEERQEAIDLDNNIASFKGTNELRSGLRGDIFLHRSGRRLELVFPTLSEEPEQVDMFQNECEGMCGV